MNASGRSVLVPGLGLLLEYAGEKTYTTIVTTLKLRLASPFLSRVPGLPSIRPNAIDIDAETLALRHGRQGNRLIDRFRKVSAILTCPFLRKDE